MEFMPDIAIDVIRFLSHNAGKIILICYLVVMVPCLMLKNRTAITMIAYLGLLEMAAWTPSIWLDPLSLMSVHVMIFTALYVAHVLYNSLAGIFGDRVLFCGACMVITDAAWFSFGGYALIYLSIINVLSLLTLWFTFKAGYTSLEIRGKNGGRDSVLWYPKIEEDVMCMPFFR